VNKNKLGICTLALEKFVFVAFLVLFPFGHFECWTFWGMPSPNLCFSFTTEIRNQRAAAAYSFDPNPLYYPNTAEKPGFIGCY